jgi:hypothetical protein
MSSPAAFIGPRFGSPENLSLTGAVRRRIVKVIAGTIPGKWDTAHDHDNPGEQ